MNQCWAIIPAAGVGTRMQADCPKQYLPLFNKTVIEHTLNVFLNNESIQGVVLVLSADDDYWPQLNIHHEKLFTAIGGAERCHSVCNGLQFLLQKANANDWVLVHDAARPCLQPSDLNRLIESVQQQHCGGLLGLPVSDTLKYCESGTVKKTVDRSGLWRALTPQMFRLGELNQALQKALAEKLLVTDEASAMELDHKTVMMIEGRADNIKITHPQDLQQAERFLQHAKELE